MRNAYTMNSESKAQGWRAIAVFKNGTEGLLYVGRSTVQVRENYRAAWAEVFTLPERKSVQRIVLQRWNGTPDCGGWQNQADLPIPAEVPPVAAAG